MILVPGVEDHGRSVNKGNHRLDRTGNLTNSRRPNNKHQVVTRNLKVNT
jgi:hypothetical protein